MYTYFLRLLLYGAGIQKRGQDTRLTNGPRPSKGRTCDNKVLWVNHGTIYIVS